MFRCLDLANTRDMLPQVPPRPPPGLACGFFSLRPILIGSDSKGELSCSTDLKIQMGLNRINIDDR